MPLGSPLSSSIHFSATESCRRLLTSAAVSHYTRSCKASAIPFESESGHSMYCRGTTMLHMVSAYIPVPVTAIWLGGSSQTLARRTLVPLRLPAHVRLHRMFQTEPCKNTHFYGHEVAFSNWTLFIRFVRLPRALADTSSMICCVSCSSFGSILARHLP